MKVSSRHSAARFCTGAGSPRVSVSACPEENMQNPTVSARSDCQISTDSSVVKPWLVRYTSPLSLSPGRRRPARGIMFGSAGGPAGTP